METINIKGKEYVTVNERIKEFWKRFPEGRILTELLDNVNDTCYIRAMVYANRTDEKPVATGLAYERESSSFINKTSYIENCETSAVGRALGMLGIGIDTSIASADEMNNALENQKKISNTHVQALEKAINNANISSDIVNEVLGKFGYKSISDILVADYMKVCNAFKEAKWFSQVS